MGGLYGVVQNTGCQGMTRSSFNVPGGMSSAVRHYPGVTLLY